MGGDQRPGLLQLAHQAIEALVGRQLRVARRDAGPGQDLLDRLAVPRAVLANVEGQQVRAENLHQPEEIVDQAGGRRRRADPAQVVGDHRQIVEQLLPPHVDAARRPQLLGQPARLQTLEIGQREPQPGGDEAALAAVRLLAAVVGDFGQQLGVVAPARRGRPRRG